MTSQQNTPATTRNTAVIVLGMHRSGTSALAGVLHELGVKMGPSLMSGRADENEKGFWEHEKIVSIHERLLAHFGSGWSDTRPLPQDWVSQSFARQCQDEICLVLEEDFGSQALWALKDPRMCRLLPMWVPVFERLDIEPLFLCIVRNPLEVAASLQRRDNMARDRALLLWLQHNLRIVESTVAYRRRFLTFDQLLGQGAPLLVTILQDYSLHPVGLPVPAAGPGALLSSDLRHHVVSDAALDTGDAVPAAVTRLYRLLGKAAASATDPEEVEWQAIRASYQESRHLLTPWLGLSETLRQDIASRNVSFEELHQENEQLALGLQHAETLVQGLEAHVQELDAALNETKALAIGRLEENEALATRIAETDAALDEARALAIGRMKGIQALSAQLGEAQSALVAELSQTALWKKEAEDLQSKMQHIRETPVWRLARAARLVQDD